MSRIQSRTLAAAVLVALTLQTPRVFAEAPFSPAFRDQVQQTYLIDGHVSTAKVDAVIARLQKKREEVASLDAGKVSYAADLKGKTASAKKIEKQIDKSKAIFALDAAIETARKMRSMTSLEDLCNAAAEISDLEGAVRAEGPSSAGRELISSIGAVLGKWKVPKTSPASDEASNLVDPATHRVLSIAELEAAKARGADLSLFEPAPGSVFYTPLKSIESVDVTAASNGATIPMFADLAALVPAESTFEYDGIHATATKPKMDATRPGIKGVKYKLKFESEFNADPTVGALMMTMGFPSDITKYAEHIRVTLPKKTTLADVKRDWESYFDRDKIVRNHKIEDNIEKVETLPDGRTQIVFKKGSIELHPSKIARVGGWLMDDGDHMAKREVRGAQVIQMWLDNADIKNFQNNKLLLRKNDDGTVSRVLMNSDVGHSLGFVFQESPSLYSWKMVTSTDGNSIDFVYRNTHAVSIKDQTTLADARWAARRIAELSRAQIATAVALGGWPDCVQKAFVERMVARRNDLTKSLGLVGARNNDGFVIRLLPETSDRAAFDVEKICASSPESHQIVEKYGFDAGTFFGPLLTQAKRTLFAVARTAISGEKRIVISSKRFNVDKARPMGELIVNISRNIERNPNPKSEQDLFLVKDHLEVGTRVGVVYGPFAAVVLRANYELAYPARSANEAGTNNGFIVNMLLPKEAREGSLPESYVLKSEYSREFELGVDANQVNAVVTPGVRAYGGELKLWRSIYDHRDGKKIVLYRDRSDAALTELQLYMRLAIVQIPIMRSYQEWGTADGKGLILSQAELDANPALSKSIDKAVVEGDFSALASREQSFFSDDDFKRSMHKWNLLVWNSSREKRLDKLELTTTGEGKKEILQYRLSKGSTLAIPLLAHHDRKASVAVWSDPKKSTEYEIQVAVMGSDSKTSDKKLQEKYIHFVNGLGVDSGKLISFTPALGYTTNGQWGPLMIESTTKYSKDAMAKILKATDEEFYAALKASMSLSIASGGPGEHEVMEQAQSFLKKLARAKAETDLSARIQKLAEAIRAALYLEGNGFYSPTILGALNRLAGADTLYSRNLITKPIRSQVDMIEDAPLFAAIGQPLKGAPKYLIFEPTTAVDLYTMFDTWF